MKEPDKDVILHIRIPRGLHAALLDKTETTGIKHPDMIRMLIRGYVDGLIDVSAGPGPQTLEGMLK